jgi:deoxyhypusine synthase
MFLDL